MTAPPTASAATPAPQRVTVVRMETVVHSQKVPSVHIEYPRLILSDSKATAALEAAVRAKIIPETVGDDESMGPGSTKRAHHKAKCHGAVVGEVFSVHCQGKSYPGAGVDILSFVEGATFRFATGEPREVKLEDEVFEKGTSYKLALLNYREGKRIDASRPGEDESETEEIAVAISEKGVVLVGLFAAYGEEPKTKLLPWKTIAPMLNPSYRARFAS